MAYRTMTLILTDQASDSDALKAARALATRHEAHLDLHCLGIDPTRYEALPAGSAIVIDDGRAEARKRADALSVWAREQSSGNPARTSVEDTVIAQLSLDRHVARVARYSDLAISPRPYGDKVNPITGMIFEAALFGAGAPVLMTPKPELPEFRTIAVAWNETDESLRAIRRSMSLLEAAERVDVVMVDPPARSPERSDPGGAVALMLARHGVNCEVSVLSKTMPRVSDVLMRFAADNQADLMVMGAYGHSRFREALIGGATRDILEESVLPVMLAH